MLEPSLFLLFTERLNAAGVPYMVTGSVAGIIYGEPRMKMIAYGHKGPLAFELRRILLEQLAMEMANTHAGSLIGEALGYYLEEGMLLADVHLGNIGEAVPEGYDCWDLVITDPGHMVRFDPKWINVVIQLI